MFRKGKDVVLEKPKGYKFLSVFRWTFRKGFDVLLKSYLKMKCLKKIRNSNDFEYDDQKHLIENIISYISEDKLKVDSFVYKKLCSIIRLLIPIDQIKFISKKGPLCAHHAASAISLTSAL
jgi:hypothetical protein